MRVINKDILLLKLQQTSQEYVSELKLLFWLCMHGYDIMVEDEGE